MRTVHYWNTIIPLGETSQEFFEMMIFSWTAGLFKTLSADGINTRVDVGSSQSSLLVISWIFVAIYSGKNYLHIFIRQGKLQIFTLSGGVERRKRKMKGFWFIQMLMAFIKSMYIMSKTITEAVSGVWRNILSISICSVVSGLLLSALHWLVINLPRTPNSPQSPHLQTEDWLGR